MLENKISAGKSQLDALTSSLQTTILQISQVNIVKLCYNNEYFKIVIKLKLYF